MRALITLLVLGLILVGCPRPKPKPSLAGSIQIIATCTDPGGPCVAEVITDLDDNKTFTGFKLDDTAIRDMNEPIVNDDLTINFSSPHPITGFFSGASNPVQGETQVFSADLLEGSALADIQMEWKMKVELDDQDQYVLYLDFYTPAAG